MSNAINASIKLNNSSKNNISCLSSLGKDYPSRLKSHLEALFEPWMNWENQGVYKSDSWDDNDPDTWVWNIDHIIPNSYFKYTSPNDIECLKAWSLSNLRPLSAKQNVIDNYRSEDTELHKSTMDKIMIELEDRINKNV